MRVKMRNFHIFELREKIIIVIAKRKVNCSTEPIVEPLPCENHLATEKSSSRTLTIYMYFAWIAISSYLTPGPDAVLDCTTTRIFA